MYEYGLVTTGRVMKQKIQYFFLSKPDLMCLKIAPKKGVNGEQTSAHTYGGLDTFG